MMLRTLKQRFYLIFILFVYLLVWMVHLRSLNVQPVAYNSSRWELKPRDPYIRQHGKYFILMNYIVGETRFYGNKSITITTHGEHTNLWQLLFLLNSNSAPISYTLFTTQNDFDDVLKSLRYLYWCTSLYNEFNALVTFHICFHEDHMPANIPKSREEILERPMECNSTMIYRRHIFTYRQRHGLQYPINLVRNIARLEARTYYTLPLDPGIYPVHNMLKKFLQMIRGLKIRQPLKSIYCMPTFEILTNDMIFNISKSYLKSYIVYNMAIVYNDWWPHENNEMPYINEWFENNVSKDIIIFGITKNISNWNPISIIANDHTPLYDERFYGHDPYERLSLMHLLKELKYDFIILDNAFLLLSSNKTYDRFRLPIMDQSPEDLQKIKNKYLNEMISLFSHNEIHNMIDYRRYLMNF